jgi:hypothetical protein
MFGLVGSIFAFLLLCFACKLCFDYGRREPPVKKLRKKKKGRTTKYTSPTKQQQPQIKQREKPVVQDQMFDSSQFSGQFQQPVVKQYVKPKEPSPPKNPPQEVIKVLPTRQASGQKTTILTPN